MAPTKSQPGSNPGKSQLTKKQLAKKRSDNRIIKPSAKKGTSKTKNLKEHRQQLFDQINLMINAKTGSFITELMSANVEENARDLIEKGSTPDNQCGGIIQNILDRIIGIKLLRT